MLHRQLFDKLYDLMKPLDADFIPLNKFTSRVADYLIHLLVDLKVRPTLMAKSIESSLIFEFRRIGYFGSIEVFNDEDIVFLQKTEKGVWAQDLVFDQLENALAKIVKQFA